MRFLDHAQWAKNPKYCTGCFRMLSTHHGGAEVECSLLFADVRGSTTIAETTSPREFNRLMGRFYDTASEVLVDHDGIVDKFVGDEIIGIFVPAMASPQHAAAPSTRVERSSPRPVSEPPPDRGSRSASG